MNACWQPTLFFDGYTEVVCACAYLRLKVKYSQVSAKRAKETVAYLGLGKLIGKEVGSGNVAVHETI